MSRRKSLFALFAALTMTATAFAGGPKITEGSIESLKGEKVFNVQTVWDNDFEYDGDPFSEYYAEEVEDMKEDEETAELAEFEADWIRWKDSTYARAFANGIGNFFEDEDDANVKDIVGDINSDAKYTIIVKTIELESGGMKTAVVEVEATIVETANPEKVVARVEGIEGYGRIPYASEEVRVKDAYLRAGDYLAEELIFEELYD